MNYPAEICSLSSTSSTIHKPSSVRQMPCRNTHLGVIERLMTQKIIERGGNTGESCHVLDNDSTMTVN